MDGTSGNAFPRPHAVLSIEEFRRALDADQLLLHYQPQVDLASLEPRGAEALLRWQHPTGGLLPPSDFLPAVIHTRLMPAVTDWVLHRACAEAASWPGGSVAVNIAASDAIRPTLVASVTSALESSGLPGDRLILELTEHALLHDVDRATRNLRRLVKDGVRVSLDDFGTGYSSLLYLRQLPIDEIKIDEIFTRGLGRNADDDAIVSGLVKLGQTIGVTVVAEGVETSAQHLMLVSLGCQVGQGYFHGEPEPVFDPRSPSIEERVEARRPRRRPRSSEPVATLEAQEMIRALIREGASLHTIAAALNRQGLTTASGQRWVGATVGRALAQM